MYGAPDDHPYPSPISLASIYRQTKITSMNTTALRAHDSEFDDGHLRYAVGENARVALEPPANPLRVDCLIELTKSLPSILTIPIADRLKCSRPYASDGRIQYSTEMTPWYRPAYSCPGICEESRIKGRSGSAPVPELETYSISARRVRTVGGAQDDDSAIERCRCGRWSEGKAPWAIQCRACLLQSSLTRDRRTRKCGSIAVGSRASVASP